MNQPMNDNQKAASILRQYAGELYQGHNIGGQWPEESAHIKAEHDELMALADRLALADAGEPVAYLCNGTRFKVAVHELAGTGVYGLPLELNGRWVALVAADDDCHLARQTKAVCGEPVAWVWQSHGLNSTTNRHMAAELARIGHEVTPLYTRPAPAVQVPEGMVLVPRRVATLAANNLDPADGPGALEAFDGLCSALNVMRARLAPTPAATPAPVASEVVAQGGGVDVEKVMALVDQYGRAMGLCGLGYANAVAEADNALATIRALLASAPAGTVCSCEACTPVSAFGGLVRMPLCPTCGDKRCQRATNHAFMCKAQVIADKGNT